LTLSEQWAIMDIEELLIKAFGYDLAINYTLSINQK
jgi:hypothetical protein